MANVGDSAHTPHGVGTITEIDSVRGRKTYRVAGKAFNVWVDETKLRTAHRNFLAEDIGTDTTGRTHVNDDNSTILPFDDDPQYNVDEFRENSTIQPGEHPIDPAKRLHPSHSLDGSSAQSNRPYPGPNPDLFAKSAWKHKKRPTKSEEAPVDNFRWEEDPHFREPMDDFRWEDDPRYARRRKSARRKRADNPSYPIDPDRPVDGAAGVQKAKSNVPNPPTSPTVPPLGALGGDIPQGAKRAIGDPPGWFGFSPHDLSLGGASDYNVGDGDTHAPTVEYPSRLFGGSYDEDGFDRDFHRDEQGDDEWHQEPDLPLRDAAYRPAGLSDRYAWYAELTDEPVNSKIAQLRNDPMGYVERVGYANVAGEEHHLEDKFGAYTDLLDSDPQMRTAAWRDVRQKAMRLRREGRVKVKDVGANYIYARVRGDNGTYDTFIIKGGLYNPTGSQSISNWSCDCPWGKWAFKRKFTYVGRLCSHSYAAFLDMQSQHMRERPQDFFTKKKKKSASVIDDFKKWATDNNEGHIDIDSIANFINTRGEIPDKEAQTLYDYVESHPDKVKERNFDIPYTFDTEKAYKQSLRQLRADILRSEPQSLTPDLREVTPGEPFFTDVEQDDRKTTGPDQIMYDGEGANMRSTHEGAVRRLHADAPTNWINRSRGNGTGTPVVPSKPNTHDDLDLSSDYAPNPDDWSLSGGSSKSGFDPKTFTEGFNPVGGSPTLSKGKSPLDINDNIFNPPALRPAAGGSSHTVSAPAPGGGITSPTGQSGLSAPQAPAAPPAPSTPDAAAPLKTPGTSIDTSHPYTVQEGDTLSDIAQRAGLGPAAGGNNYQQLYEKNKGVIGGDANLIKPGEQLNFDGLKPPTPPAPGDTPHVAPDATPGIGNGAAGPEAGGIDLSNPDASKPGLTPPPPPGLTPPGQNSGGLTAPPMPGKQSRRHVAEKSTQSLLDELRDISRNADKYNKPQHMKENNERILDIVDELNDRGADASFMVASLRRLSAEDSEPYDGTSNGSFRGHSLPDWADGPFAGSGPSPKNWIEDSESYVNDNERPKFQDVTNLNDGKPGFNTMKPRQSSRRRRANEGMGATVGDKGDGSWGEHIGLGDESNLVPHGETNAPTFNDMGGPVDILARLHKAEREFSTPNRGEGARRRKKAYDDMGLYSVGDMLDSPHESAEPLPQREGGIRRADSGSRRRRANDSALIGDHDGMTDMAEGSWGGGSAANPGVGNDVVANFQRSAGAQNIMGKSSSGDYDIAASAQRFLKTAGRHYTMAEQRELEEEYHPLGARNKPTDDDLQGTHYV